MFNFHSAHNRGSPSKHFPILNCMTLSSSLLLIPYGALYLNPPRDIQSHPSVRPLIEPRCNIYLRWRFSPADAIDGGSGQLYLVPDPFLCHWLHLSKCEMLSEYFQMPQHLLALKIAIASAKLVFTLANISFSSGVSRGRQKQFSRETTWHSWAFLDAKIQSK